MRKIYSFIFILYLFSILSCKKDSVKIEDGLYIRFMVGGNENIFTQNVQGSISTGYNYSEFFSGTANEIINVNTKNIVILNINAKKEITTNKEYSKKDMANNNIAILYLDSMGKQYDLSTIEGDDVLSSDAKIMIISRSEHSLKGAFSGTLYNISDMNDHLFVSGTFSLKE